MDVDPASLHFPTSFAINHDHVILFLTMEGEQKSYIPFLVPPHKYVSCMTLFQPCHTYQLDANIQGNLGNHTWKMTKSLSPWVPEWLHGPTASPHSRYAIIPLLPSYYIKSNFIKPLKCGDLSVTTASITQTIMLINFPFTQKSAICYVKYVT